MADRIIRDELTRSHRYRTLSSDTLRLLFVHMLLNVDSLGNMEADATSIGDMLHRYLDDTTAASMLAELADRDLVRVYNCGGKRYLHVPRFRQRLRYLHGKHPRPPVEIECNEIRVLIEKVGLKSGRDPVKYGKSEVKRSEAIQKALSGVRARVAMAMPQNKAQDQKSAVLKNESEGQEATPFGQWTHPPWINATAKTLGITQREGEKFDAFRDRVISAVQQRRATKAP